MLRKFIVILALLLLGGVSAGQARAAQVRISSAASLSEVLKALVADYRKDHPGVELTLNLAASGALARQLEAGAPADLYISANPKWMDYLQQQGLIDADASRVLVRNSLVFVGLPPGVGSLEMLPELKRIALGSPRSVPAGRYAEQALTKAGLYARLQADRKLILAKDVRQALLYAERGEVDGAFVYRTDGLLARQAKILFEVPGELYPPVVYPAALTRSGQDNPDAAAFFDYLLGSAAQQLFQRYGFLPRAEGASP